MSRLLAILAALLALCSNVFGGAMVLLPLMDESTSFVTGIVARWTFSTDALDSSGNGYHATLTNGAAVTGGSLLLDGTNDYAFVADADALTPTNGLTISCWVKLKVAPLNSSDIVQLVAKEDSIDRRSYYLAYNGWPEIIFLTSSNGTSVIDSRHSAAITTDSWHHVAAILSGTNLTIMLDGVAKNRTGGTAPYVVAPIYKNNSPLYIGARHSPAINFLNGRVGDVRIYNYAKKTNDVINIKNEGSPP